MKLAILTSGQFVMPPLPEWPRGVYVPTKFSDAVAAIKRQSPYATIQSPKDSLFLTVPSAAVAPAAQWTLAFLKNAGVKYTTESLDCENIATALWTTLCMMTAKAGLLAAPCVGMIDVSCVNAWAGVRAGGSHELVLVITEKGPIVVEAQNGSTIALEEYPNRANILAADGF